MNSELKADLAELKADMQRLMKIQAEILAQVTEIAATVATKADVERILSAVDALVKRSEAHELERSSRGDMLQ